MVSRRIGSMTALIVLIFTGCSGNDNESPEQQVKTVLASMETAIEERDISSLFGHISEEYQDHKGNNKQSLRRVAQIYLFKNQSVGVVTSINALQTIDASTVTLEASLLMGSKSSNHTNNLLPQIRADTQQISVIFRRQNNLWKVTSLSWQNQGRY